LYSSLATPADAAAIGALRVWDRPTFASPMRASSRNWWWTDEDDVAEVIAAWRENEPVATMRLEVTPIATI
jgi:hypothetical protein